MQLRDVLCHHTGSIGLVLTFPRTQAKCGATASTIAGGLKSQPFQAKCGATASTIAGGLKSQPFQAADAQHLFCGNRSSLHGLVSSALRQLHRGCSDIQVEVAAQYGELFQVNSTARISTSSIHEAGLQKHSDSSTLCMWVALRLC
jgi:hypothetical protein